MNNINYHLNKEFESIAVLGSGTMGSQITAHFANLGFDVIMFDINKEALESSIKALKKIKPPPLASGSVTENIKTATYDSLDLLNDRDLIVESVVEDLDIKKNLFANIAPYISDKAVLVTNTSGLSIEKIAKHSPHKIRDRIFGVHFFNPPRYMPLVEIISTTNSDQRLLLKVEGFITSYLGKEVVYANDKPAFIANRIGIFSLLIALHHAKLFDIDVDTVDALTGTKIGRPSSATFRTLDVVGLDVILNIVNNIYINAKEDPWIELFQLPKWIHRLINKGYLGSKTRKGIYEKVGSDIYVLDIKKDEYRPSLSNTSPELNKILKENKGIENSLLLLADSEDRHAQFLWAIHRDIFHYAASQLESVGETVRCVDIALKSGFGWKNGVFEYAQITGWNSFIGRLKEDIKNAETLSSEELPIWVDNISVAYNHQGAYSPTINKYIPRSSHPVYKKQLFPKIFFGEKIHTQKVLLKNESIKLIDLGDGVASISFKTKMNVLSLAVIKGIDNSLDFLEENGYSALVIKQEDNHFCVGANLNEIIEAANIGLYKISDDTNTNSIASVEEIITSLQEMVMRLKHGKVITIAAVDGYALGGGCEVMLHCNRVIASINSNIGLVEVAVGLLPGGCGTKEMSLRAHTSESENSKQLLSMYFEQIATARVSTSALHAKEMGYLRSDDLIIANSNELLFEAKKQSIAMVDSGFESPKQEELIVSGKDGYAYLNKNIKSMNKLGSISGHDLYCLERIAKIMTVANVEQRSLVNSSVLVEMEKVYFVEMIKNKKTQERINYMLKNNKRLFN
jgi:3-hydroxyacyl-CoA dehydrogenase